MLVAQSCPTLCNPKDRSPPGSSVHGDSPNEHTGVGCHALPTGDLPNPGIKPRSPVLASLVAQLVKNPPAMRGDLGSIPGLGRSPGEGRGYPLQCSGLENFMDCIVHGVTKSQTRLSNFHFSDLFQTDRKS